MSNMKKKEFLKMAVRLMMSRQRKLSPMEKRQHKRNHGFKKPVSESILAQQKYGNRSKCHYHFTFDNLDEITQEFVQDWAEKNL